MPSEATDTINSIFGGSLRHLSQEAGSGFTASAQDVWAGDTTFTVSIILSVLITILFLSEFINAFPSILGSFARWKECVNLYDSVSIRRSRDKAFLMTIFPAILLIARNSLFPSFLGTSPKYCILSAAIALGAYLFLRLLCNLIFIFKKISISDYACACSTGRTFFIAAVLISILTVWILRIFGIDSTVIHNVILWEIAIVYALFLLRKTEIFVARRGFFAGILYLCTLEFLPTGLMIGVTYILQICP